jgi:hypothetical protein
MMNWDVSAKGYPIKEVNISNLKNYLKDRGWIKESSGREEAVKFKSPRPFHEDKFIEVLIPSQEDLVDYKRSIEIAIDFISVFERRSFEDVLSQILIFGDSIRFKISNPETKNGSIPISEGVTLYQNARDLLIYGACAETSSKKNFPRVLEDAVEFTEDCLIGQSQYGSFIANIHCKFERPTLKDLEGNFVPPLGRNIVLRILRGFENIRESTEEGNSEPIVKNYLNGLNANMCDTLAEIINVGVGNDIDISASLEPILKVPEGIHTDFILQPSSVDYLMEASKILKGEVPDEKLELEGLVFQLTKKSPEDENIIKIYAIHEDKGVIPITIKLDVESYNVAIDAHKNRKPIRIAGILQKRGRTWFLKNPEGLKTIDKY